MRCMTNAIRRREPMLVDPLIRISQRPICCGGGMMSTTGIDYNRVRDGRILGVPEIKDKGKADVCR